ncbi:MAG: endonuclease [Saprospiraceae bacterium]|nr:MAG: endonuclease [Saprospiraceae bacterium]
MKKYIRIARKPLFFFLLIVILYFAIVLTYGTLTDFQPEAEIKLEPTQSSTVSTVTDSILSFTTWNLGYGGLGAESEFFFDSGNMYFSQGKMIRASQKNVEKNVAGILNFVPNIKSDFFLFQEVDFESKRSFYINEYQEIAALLPTFSASFAVNYQSDWVPIPVFEPWRAYGKTTSGLATYSRFQPTHVTRFQLPGTFSWPTRIFQLDRCAAVSRFSTSKGNELVVINIHNSAYDQGGFIKRQQMEFLQKMFVAEYEKGNYVVVGGDWNQCPPYFRFDGFMPEKTSGHTQINISPDFFPEGWTWGYDTQIPTNRKTNAPYLPGETFITLIDFFLVSPNIKINRVKGIDQQFQFSDHQPVWMEIELLDW